MIDLEPANGRAAKLIRLQLDLQSIAVYLPDGMTTEVMSSFVPECQIETGCLAGGPLWIVSDRPVTSAFERNCILEAVNSSNLQLQCIDLRDIWKPHQFNKYLCISSNRGFHFHV
ncbi:hypothetical protein EAS56_17660 [Bradyrhizobium guangzhouense]|uniref:Uncharacterized protein n=1 Tax=Bradyrhizobium guangzhouense TaxID=1325095 RepID=A0ABY0E4W8_9BRAD|nr:hypothetical protein EAS56_17660 [Bradyrhizobium guangzhouense]